MSDISLREYSPDIYKGFVEYETLISAEDKLFKEVEQATNDLTNNQFVLLASVEGIEQYESMLKIVANPSTESLQFRRDRIMNRMAFPAPFSISALRNKLDSILGKGQYNVYVDYNNYTLYIESSAIDQSWFDEILITMVQTKPANLIFVNKPLVSYSMALSEKVSYKTRRWNYRAGYWVLGEQPFSSVSDGGIIKMESTASLNPNFIQSVAQFTADDIKKVAINGSFIFSQFITKQASNGECVIEYSVPAGTFDAITSIALLDANGNALTSFAVYIPVLDDVIIKHIIKVKEG